MYKALTEGGQAVRDVRDVRDLRDVRGVNVPKKTKNLMLITSLNPTSLWCFSPDPINVDPGINRGCF